MALESGAHALLIIVVGTAGRNAHDLQRPTERRGLLLQKRGAHAVHTDALVYVGHRRQQSDHLVPIGDLEQGQSAVLATAPRDDNFFQGKLLFRSVWPRIASQNDKADNLGKPRYLYGSQLASTARIVIIRRRDYVEL